MHSKNLYLKITDYSMMVFHLRQRNLVAQYPQSVLKKYPLYIKSCLSWRQTSAFRRQAVFLTELQYSTRYKSGIVLDFSLAATDSDPPYTNVFYCGENMFFTLHCKPVGSWRISITMVIALVLKIQRLHGGQCHIWRYSCNTHACSRPH